MRILFISANRIGDAVLTTGLLDWLHRTYPQARFTIACGPVTADLFRGFPALDELVILKKQKWNGHWLHLWRHCIDTQWDMIVDLRNSLVSRLLRAKSKHTKPAHSSGQHKLLDLASIFGLSPPPAPTLWLPQAARDAAQLLIGSTQGPLLALGPAANWAPKQWPIENFIALAQSLLSAQGLGEEARLMIVAAPHERQQVTPLLNAFPSSRVIDGIGQDLLTVAACLAKATLFVGNDSGLMHIAAAVNVPTLGLFGPSDEKVYGPWGDTACAVRTPESKDELFARLPSPAATSPCLMTSLRLEDVIAACSRCFHPCATHL